MKILSCHIENFGKISDYSMDFCDGANVICEENGWGKSTFAAFVRAMFYGLEGDRKRSLDENERKKYKPWQGGVFGGQLVFEIQGKAYRISRIFKDKETNDEFELRDAKTNLPSKDYTKRIGEEIFRINRESFLRTIFIGQNQCETSSTDDINAKIGKLADNSNDLNNFEAANEKLAEIISKMNPNRVSGSISKRSEEIAKYERIVKGGEGISASIEEYQKYLHVEEDNHEMIKSQMKEAGEKQKKVSEQQSVIARKSEWERLKRTVARKKEEKEALRQKFPGNIPDLEDVKKKIAECSAMERAHERVSTYRFSEEEKGEFAALADTFGNGVPLTADIEEKINETIKYRNLSREYNAGQMSPAEKERLDELESYFGDESESVTFIVGKWNNRNTREASLPSKKAALMALKASMESRRPPRSGKLFIFWIIGIILFGIAGVTIVERAPAVGAIIAAVGVAVIVAGILINRKAAGAVQTEFSPEFENLRKAIEDDEAFIAEADEDVAAYLEAHGKSYSEDTVSVVLQEITAESIEYSSLKKKFLKSADSKEVTELENLRRSVKDFLCRYGVASIDSELADDLYILKNKAEKYKVLAEKQNNLEKAESDHKAFRERAVSFLNQYDYEAADNVSLQFGEIRDLVDEYQNSARTLEEAEKELKQFETENDVSVLEETQVNESLPTLEELNQMIQQLAEKREEIHNKISGYNNTLEVLQEEYDEWEENCIRLKELKELQSVEQIMYRHVYLAKTKLELAKEVMTAKYADPIFQRFSQYYGMISGRNADDFHIDANTTITVDELGKQRDTDALSSGYRDLIGICLRIALVDVMYQEEAPMLIMDDPFTNLDDKKVGAGRGFVEKLAEKYQIIYFTCSTSRR